MSLLTLHVLRLFVLRLTALLLVISGLVWIVDLFEMSRRVAGKPGVGIGDVVLATVLKSPAQAHDYLHLIVFLAAALTFWQLVRMQEFIAASAAGASPWRLLLPLGGGAALFGILWIALISPWGALGHQAYERLRTEMLGERPGHVLDLFDSGIWLRQYLPSGAALTLHAPGRKPDTGIVLAPIMVLEIGPQQNFVRRMDAQSAELLDGHWHLTDVVTTYANNQQRRAKEVLISTSLTAQTIEESFLAPRSLGFWRLPGFIDVLEGNGFSHVSYQLHYQRLVAMPLSLVAMVFLAGGLFLRHHRQRHAAWPIAIGVGASFFVFVLTSFLAALATTGTVSPLIAMWTPPSIVLFGSASLIVYLEDG
ncbi:MAG: LptF/LptG family permease [Pseudomonadota bacterium]